MSTALVKALIKKTESYDILWKLDFKGYLTEQYKCHVDEGDLVIGREKDLIINHPSLNGVRIEGCDGLDDLWRAVSINENRNTHPNIAELEKRLCRCIAADDDGNDVEFILED